MSFSTTRLYRGRIPRPTSDNFELGDHDFCLSRSHYTDTDPTSRDRAATSRIKPEPPYQELRALPTELPPPPPLIHTHTQIKNSHQYYGNFFLSFYHLSLTMKRFQRVGCFHRHNNNCLSPFVGTTRNFIVLNGSSCPWADSSDQRLISIVFFFFLTFRRNL